jgi:hypothetical protein
METNKLESHHKPHHKQQENKKRENTITAKHPHRTEYPVFPFLSSSERCEYLESSPNEDSPRLKKSQEVLMTKKVMSKLEEKRKLLKDSSLTKLNIHWHEEREDKNSSPYNNSEGARKARELETSKEM